MPLRHDVCVRARVRALTGTVVQGLAVYGGSSRFADASIVAF